MALVTFAPALLPALISFLNTVLAGHRHWVPISTAEFAERVIDRPGFDPQGLILAVAGERVIGGVHAIKPLLLQPPYQHVGAQPSYGDLRHDIAWLAVAPEARGHGLGDRLLCAAEDYLYYCPTYFAGQTVPFYGIIESLWVPWYGSTERMGVSATNDTELIAWLAKRGYQTVCPGDISMVATVRERERPQDPGLARRGLALVPINEQSPWSGDEASYRLRAWGHNGGRPYWGLVAADGARAVGSVAWYPLPPGVVPPGQGNPDRKTAALAWLGLEQPYRGLHFGAYLLDCALAEMSSRGYASVEVHVHTKDNPEAFGLFRNRGFQVMDYWVNLVKT